jgi:membrane protein implicated in regulation of membrane protease activity
MILGATLLQAAPTVVRLRPPVGSLRRGAFPLPPGPTTALVVLAVLALVALVLYRRLRRRPRQP